MIGKKLPIGTQTFREMRKDGYCRVDKTGMALKAGWHPHGGWGLTTGLDGMRPGDWGMARDRTDAVWPASPA